MEDIQGVVATVDDFDRVPSLEETVLNGKGQKYVVLDQ
jgi:hypothetical protein